MHTTQHALDDLNEFSAHHLRLKLGESLAKPNQTAQGEIDVKNADDRFLNKMFDAEEEVALIVRLDPVEGISTTTAKLRPHSIVLDVSYIAAQVPSTTSSSSTLANVIAKTLQETFAEEQASIAYILSASHSSATGQQSSSSNGQSLQHPQSVSTSRDSRNGLSRTIPSKLAAKLARRTTRAVKYAPLYHITISLFTPTAAPSSWAIESAIEEYFTPLLELFSISNFTIDTQVQLYASFSSSVQPVYDAEFQRWTLKKEDLSSFINAAEWPLGPSIGAGPTLNFVVYVPDASVSPLVVKDNHASSWLIPQWGGVTILNPQRSNTMATTGFLTKEALQPALMTFSHQLLSLLGAPESPPSFPMQMKTLTRVKAASLLLSASSTMGSLARLTVALPSIAIPESVATAVDNTLSHLHDTCTHLRDGKFAVALEHARIAEVEAEKGFFEKSMVGQVYFPDEHKFAVYLPLLGPLSVSLVMSALKEIKRLWNRQRVLPLGN